MANVCNICIIHCICTFIHVCDNISTSSTTKYRMETGEECGQCLLKWTQACVMLIASVVSPIDLLQQHNTYNINVVNCTCTMYNCTCL